MGRQLRVLGLLQNQWARNSASVAAMFARRPEHRHELIARMLMQSTSGRRLRAAFGVWLDRIVWENASPGVVERADGCLAPDIAHVNGVLASIRPDVVIAFGVQATRAIEGSSWRGVTFTAPHPAARCHDVQERLCVVRDMLAARLDA